MGVFFTLIIGFILGLLPEIIIIILCFGLLRVFAGGGHCSSLWRCAFSSCVTILATAFTARGIALIIPESLWVITTGIWSLLVTWIWAPNNSEKPVYNPHRRRYLRHRALMISLALSLILLYLASNEVYRALAVAGGTAIAAGAFLLTPVGISLIKRVDSFLVFFFSFFLR